MEQEVGSKKTTLSCHSEAVGRRIPIDLVEKMKRLDNIQRGDPITITINGSPVEAYPGESIAAVLLASGRRIFRRTPANDTPRGFFCGMGICFDCLVTVDGVPNVRSCMIEVRPGCVVDLPSPSGREAGGEG